MLLETLAETWLERMKNRKRRPVKPASLAAWGSYIRTWIVPLVGEVEAENFENGTLKEFAEKIAAAGKSPKTVLEIVGTLKQIIASAEDVNGNRLYPRNWNDDFVLENIEEPGAQSQPTITKEALQAVLNNRSFSTRDRVFVATLSATGLRLGEMLAVRISPCEDSYWAAENKLIQVNKSVYRGSLQAPKTKASVRTVDLPEDVNAMLAKFTEGRKSGEFLFSTKGGQSWDQGYVRKHILAPLGIPGAHALRRFRATHLREAEVPYELVQSWLGHANGGDITKRYVKISENLKLRRYHVERAGIGFSLANVFKISSDRASARTLRAAKQSEEKRLAALGTHLVAPEEEPEIVLQ